MAFAGGAVMGIGAVLARGCTSGQALTGGALLSVGSWAFMLGAFAARLRRRAGVEAGVAMTGRRSLRARAIGVAFGFALERAGLGSARKLTGQFYLTDLTVFKVMFTAIVTAMLGVFWLSRLGWIDLDALAFPRPTCARRSPAG